MRTRPPALRTLPSSTCVTFSSRTTFWMSTCLHLYMKALLLDATASADTLLKSVMMSSVLPSLKYSFSESPLFFSNDTAPTEKRLDSCADGEDVGALLPFAAC